MPQKVLGFDYVEKASTYLFDYPRTNAFISCIADAF
jgi:hypothetical protein